MSGWLAYALGVATVPAAVAASLAVGSATATGTSWHCRTYREWSSGEPEATPRVLAWGRQVWHFRTVRHPSMAAAS